MNQTQQNQKLYVGNLNFEANEDQVRELFSSFGDVQDVKIVMDRFTGRSRGFAFVRFDTAESAEKAREALNGQAFQGKTLVIDLARSEQREPRPMGERRERSGGGFGGGEGRPRREWGGNDRGERRGFGGHDRGDRFHGR
ncbi:MAG TPA: RNA-binding protein [Chlamydiales bacterium]|jgi:RNA recognition motif-containing protein|nr:RNA-binding protein [Chlamydiales bacterium]